MTSEIRKELFGMQDKKYADFQRKLIPTVAPDRIIGVRTPELRKYAATLRGREDLSSFLHQLPHRYFDENQLHAFIISGIKEFDRCMDEVCRFLPHVDNWATCDQMSPKVFKKQRKDILPYLSAWISSGETYMVRFAIGMFMEHFLDGDFDPAYPEMIAHVRSEEYYVQMMIAWYFATALAKQYREVLPYLEKGRLDIRTHNKTIQKAVESRRITEEQKSYLKTLRKKSGPLPISVL